MILLLGGTAETASLATMLAEAGYGILVSTATDTALDTGSHPRIERRTGPLDERGLVELISRHGIRAVVDATHPYAKAARTNAEKAAKVSRIPYFTYVRPRAIPPGEDVLTARDHAEAATLAFSLGRPVFLTTGSRNISPYAAAAWQTGVTLVARVLNTRESLQACRTAGIPEENIILGRGPFSLEQNTKIIEKFGIGVVVTKDSGTPGGVDAKLEAARREGCVLVVVSRPEAPDKDAFSDRETLLDALRVRVAPDTIST